VLDRLSALDTTFLYAESERMPMHVGVLAVLDRAEFDHERLLTTLEARSWRAPRTRQRLVTVPAELGRPGLVDDPDFDIANHVRWMATPRPYDDDRARAFVAELMKQPLPRDRPLWQLLVFDMTDARTGLILLIHHCITDGVAGLELARAFLDDDEAGERPDERDGAGPAQLPGAVTLVAGAATGFIADQASLARSVARSALGGGAVRTLTAGPRLAGRVLGAGAQPSAPPAFKPVGADRSFATVKLALADVKRVKERFGCKVNDVMLACAAAGLSRAMREQSRELGTATASVPVNTRVAGAQARNAVSQVVVELPLDETDPVLRLETIAQRMLALKSSRTVGAGTSVMELANAAPPAVLWLASRAAASRAPADALITNVPGPETPLHLLGARVREMYPIAPLAGTSALAVAILSYAGQVCLGVCADPAAIPRLGPLVEGIGAELRALLEAAA
jgi:diacylglycerol O-acyltransferase / wax synthase